MPTHNKRGFSPQLIVTRETLSFYYVVLGCILFFILEFEVSELSPEVAAFLIMAAAVSIGFLIGWCVRPDDHAQEDDAIVDTKDELDSVIDAARKGTL